MPTRRDMIIKSKYCSFFVITSIRVALFSANTRSRSLSTSIFQNLITRKAFSKMCSVRKLSLFRFLLSACNPMSITPVNWRGLYLILGSNLNFARSETANLPLTPPAFPAWACVLPWRSPIIPPQEATPPSAWLLPG